MLMQALCAEVFVYFVCVCHVLRARFSLFSFVVHNEKEPFEKEQSAHA
jgi:hypothetical protein